MTRLIGNLCCLGLLASLAGMASGADVQGVLMDKMCSAKIVTGGQKAAAAHDRECAMAPACEKSGYGVYTSDGKWLDFDEAGNQKAIAALKASKKADNLNVTVKGDVGDGTIKVASLKLQ